MQFWTNWTSWDKSAFRQKIVVTTLESLNIKVIANLLCFPLVTHMASSNTWFDSYEFSKRTVVLNGSGQIGNWSETSGLG
jgi:hypothetical protein